MAEAGTGTGKSLAYLVPALLSGQRVVVATATKALQEQLLTKDVPAAAAALGRPVRVAVVKGRQNYLCRKGLQGVDQLGGLFRTAEDAADFERLRDWIAMTETGDRAELDFEPSVSLWSELSVGAERCAGRRCPLVGSCFAEKARERAGEAELVIANHALYFADLALRTRSDGAGVLPEHDAVVFDEAHRLEEAAAAWFGGRISLARLRQLERDVERFCREESRTPPARPLAEVDRAGERLIGAFDPGSGAAASPPQTRRSSRSTASSSRPRSARSPQRSPAPARKATRSPGARSSRPRTWRAASRSTTPTGCRGPSPGTVAWAPVDVSGLLYESLWESGTTAILVSATLDPGFVRRRLGLEDARELVLPSPFDYRDQALVYVPTRVPEPRSPGYYDRLADEIVSLCRLSAGRALVLTSSYRALDELVSRCASRLQFPVLRQGDAPRERLLERFREDIDSILFATATFWQGVDIQGESLSLLVIDKLPFAAPGDPLVEARCERITQEGGDWFAEYALPAAVLQLRQGFGRLIRGHGDEGVVAILDPRLRSRAYGRRFLEALPPAPVVADLAAVADFFGAQARATA